MVVVGDLIIQNFILVVMIAWTAKTLFIISTKE